MALAVLVWLAACGNGASSGGSGRSADALRPFTYEETTAGLEALIHDIMSAASSGDRARADMLARSLELETPQAWFRKIFGEELGDELFIEYAPVRGRLVQLADVLGTLSDKGQTRVTVERFDKPGDQASTVYQSLALERMSERTPVYSVRLVTRDGGRVFHIWSFVYQAGWFRWIGKTKQAARDKAPEGEPDVREYRLGDADKARQALR